MQTHCKTSVTTPIFCCSSAVPIHTSQNNKPHQDPNREIHDAIFRSFLLFATRQQHQISLVTSTNGEEPEKPQMPTPPQSPPPIEWPFPVLTFEALANNPCTPQTPYVIHLTSRHDYGPVYSHRYFACPQNLQESWIEISLIQWFAEGEPFKMKAEKWDLKCDNDKTFFRMTLRPNLNMRLGEDIEVRTWAVKGEEVPAGSVDIEGFEGTGTRLKMGGSL